MIDCPDSATLVDQGLDRVLTQYRESPRLLAMVAAGLERLAEVHGALCPLPDFFDIDTAIGDQLTIIGKWLGWPRTHCRGARAAVFGFESPDCDPCDTADGPIIGGFCHSHWDGCPSTDYMPYTFIDDALYRRFLKARVVQLYGDYRRATLTHAVRLLFDADDAAIVREWPGVVQISLGRPFEPGERQILHLYPEVLPVALGVRLEIRGLGAPGPVFGFGAGWGELCDGQWLSVS
jgi:hypothetical protein